MPARQPKRGRPWLDDGSCVRLRPERANHVWVWACDFVEDRIRDGRKLRLLNVVDEFTRERLCIRVARKRGSAEVIDVLADLFIARGAPVHVRSDNGPEFVAIAKRSVGDKDGEAVPGREGLDQRRGCVARCNPEVGPFPTVVTPAAISGHASAAMRVRMSSSWRP